ncbi:ABC transporter permease subunit [Polaromonas sp. P1(28)-13]|nr:ABC transporter permease subunit [Polaromonas sp. P1(28)-13]
MKRFQQATQAPPPVVPPLPPDRIVMWQVILGIALLVGWEIAGRTLGDSWISRPLLIFSRLQDWAMVDLHINLLTTLGEMVIGMLVGVPLGIACGLWLGSSPTTATVLRPIIVGFYSVPLLTLIPLFILWFGLGMQSKVMLIAIVVFFLLFFNTFSGVKELDVDLVTSLKQMGASRREVFQKVVMPGAVPWIFTGLKIAFPMRWSARSPAK